MKATQFCAVSSQIRFPQIETEVLEFWHEQEIFKKSLDNTRGKSPYVFYDGPPFATGLPHYGHLLAGTLKDIIPRYWTMRNHYVERRFGWDCHGLPVENEVEKEFKIGGRRAIEKLGIHLFNEACRSIVLRYTAEWERVVNRMGRWVDFVNQYRTMDPTFMESVWWVFRQVWDKDLVYQGFCVQPYCPRCATPLSNSEVSEGYKDVKGPSITVSFPLKDDPSAKFLVWTTTPWTLPSNVALAVGPAIKYVKIRDGADIYILAKDRISSYYRKESDYELIAEIEGRELARLRYEPLFPWFTDRSQDFFKVTTADFVSTEDGTGIVHIAPAFGEEDFKVGKALNLPIVCPVDDEGRFTDEVPDWKGKRVFDADEEIVVALKKNKRLVHRGTIEHRYPFCYRCDTPLIYKAINAWFVSIGPLKKGMLENNERIRWVPEHLKTGRFANAIESSPDWNISRNRYWGTPIPIWLCGCGHRECVGSLDQFHELAAKGDKATGEMIHAQRARDVFLNVKNDAPAKLKEIGVGGDWLSRITESEISPVDLHRHVVDAVVLYCPKCGQPMERTPEVLDCWFESGSMPYAQNHYPFENKELFEASFPADFIAEGLDQTRGWFNKLTVLAQALFGKEAFRNVIVNGIILAEDGKKLSKRLKNYTPPEDVLSTLGADALRLFLIDSPAVKAEDLRYSDKGVQEITRSVLIPFWNAYAFFVTYANVDDWTPRTTDPPSEGTELDQWIISLLNHVIAQVNIEMEQYNLYKVVPLLVDFIDNLTNWYIRRSRRRFWRSENDGDKDMAYSTLYYVLVEFAKVMAPFLPFVTEAIYRNLAAKKLPDAPQSVHLTSYPQARAKYSNPDLELKMLLVRGAVAMGRALRSRFTIKTRQPLREFTIVVRDPQKLALLQQMESLIREELNVKSIRLDTHEDVVVSIAAKPNYKKLGREFGPRMKEAAQAIEALSSEQIRNLESGATVPILDRAIGFDDIEIRRTRHEGVEVETEGELTVALDTVITPELKAEGYAREFINRVQNLRKTSGLNVTDRITIRCVVPENLKMALTYFSDYICSETLAGEILFVSPEDAGTMEEIEVDDMKAAIQVQKS